jgi:peptidoglycan/LPS O-acetylase OafA/YrhL
MSKNDEHLPFLDNLRGVAILLVFVCHAFGVTFWTEFKWNGWFRNLDANPAFLALSPAGLGWVGVAIFFVVSGFCIHLSHQRSLGRSWRTFFIRRFFRIYPPYLAALIFFAAITWAKIVFHLSLDPAHFESFESMKLDLATHFVLIHNFFDQFYYGHINGPFWSIAVEVPLYLLYPLLLWIAARHGWSRTLALTAVIEIGLRTYLALVTVVHPDAAIPRWLSDSPFAYWLSWTLGVVLADAWMNRSPLPFVERSLFFWPALFLSVYWFKPLTLFGFTLAALAAARVMAHGLGPTAKQPLLLRATNPLGRFIRFTGIISYSVYLLHEPFLTGLSALFKRYSPVHFFASLALFAGYLLFFFIIAGIAWFFYRFIELPSISWGKWFIQRNRPPPLKPS